MSRLSRKQCHLQAIVPLSASLRSRSRALPVLGLQVNPAAHTHSICHSRSPVFSPCYPAPGQQRRACFASGSPGMWSSLMMMNGFLQRVNCWPGPLQSRIPRSSVPGHRRCFAPCCSRIFPRMRSGPALAISSLWKNNR